MYNTHLSAERLLFTRSIIGHDWIFVEHLLLLFADPVDLCLGSIVSFSRKLEGLGGDLISGENQKPVCLCLGLHVSFTSVKLSLQLWAQLRDNQLVPRSFSSWSRQKAKTNFRPMIKNVTKISKYVRNALYIRRYSSPRQQSQPGRWHRFTLSQQLMPRWNLPPARVASHYIQCTFENFKHRGCHIFHSHLNYFSKKSWCG